MQKTKQRNHYSEPFRRTIIEEYLSSGKSKYSILQKYDIKFKGALQRWMRLYGYVDIWKHKNVKFEQPNLSILAKNKSPLLPSDETDLLKKIKELERQLQDAQLLSEGYSMMIDIAEKEYKIPIRKKRNTK